MSTYRIYVDSRDRQPGGRPEDFTYALPYSLNITEKSLANIDAVVIPNSIQTVIAGKNDIIYLQETDNLSGSPYYRFPKIQGGYYTVQSLALAISEALTNVTGLPGTYNCEFNERLGRYQFSNTAQRFGYSFEILSREVMLYDIENSPTYIPIRENGNGAWKLLGCLTGPNIIATGGEPVIPAVAHNAPNLQFATQLFIKTSLGIEGRSVGAKGNMSISRRVIMDQPPFALVVDRHATSWDSFQIAATTLISTFTVILTDYNNNIIDLNGQDWSFSITIFKRRFKNVNFIHFIFYNIIYK